MQADFLQIAGRLTFRFALAGVYRGFTKGESAAPCARAVWSLFAGLSQ